MGIFDKEHNNKCTCMHCRGGHNVPLANENENQIHYEIDTNETVFEAEQFTPEEIIQEALDLIAESETLEEIQEILIEFFEVVSAYTVEEIYLSDIKAKIEVLNMLKEKRN
jgi:hypothetical protein